MTEWIDNCVKVTLRRAQEKGEEMDTSKAWKQCQAKFKREVLEQELNAEEEKVLIELESGQECGCMAKKAVISMLEAKGHTKALEGLEVIAPVLEQCFNSAFQSCKRAGLSNEKAKEKALAECEREGAKMSDFW